METQFQMHSRHQVIYIYFAALGVSRVRLMQCHQFAPLSFSITSEMTLSQCQADLRVFSPSRSSIFLGFPSGQYHHFGLPGWLD